MNKRGFTLIELLIVTVVGLFILEAAYLLYTGSLKLFKDVRTINENVETKIPSMELIARYFDRWGVGVSGTGTVSTNCTYYSTGLSNEKCLTKTAGTPCDEIIFWGNAYGAGFVQNVTSGTAYLTDCRLSKSSGENCYYLWRNNVLQNDIDSGTGNVILLSLNSNLSTNNADCTSLTGVNANPTTVTTTLSPNASVSATLKLTDGTDSTKILQAGDIIQRAPHKIRLYCAPNSNDNNQTWLYADLGDTASDCNSNEPASPIAPVDSFQVTFLPAGCNASSGGCFAANVTVTFRSQSKDFSKSYKTYTVQRIFGR